MHTLVGVLVCFVVVVFASVRGDVGLVIGAAIIGTGMTFRLMWRERVRDEEDQPPPGQDSVKARVS